MMHGMNCLPKKRELPKIEKDKSQTIGLHFSAAMPNGFIGTLWFGPLIDQLIFLTLRSLDFSNEFMVINTTYDIGCNQGRRRKKNIR